MSVKSSFQKIKRLLSNGKSLINFKMVRFFPNPFIDYAPEQHDTLIAKPENNEVVNLIDEHIKRITKRLTASPKNVDGGLYIGISGVSYMFYHLSKNALLSENKNVYLGRAMDYIKPALETSAGDKTSFLLGDAGTYALATVLRKELGDNGFTETLNAYKSLYSRYLAPGFLKCGGDEFFVGRAGYLAGALWMSRELGSPVLNHLEFFKLCDVMVDSGREFAQITNSPCPLMYQYYNTKYIGAAHGISFILLMLLSVPGYLEFNKGASAHIKESVDYILSLQKEGNWPSCMEEAKVKDHKLLHWCHGAPGVVYLMAKAYLVYKDQKYLDSCIEAGEVTWQKGLLTKGPGICHGVAGNGYVFLLLYRLTNDSKYLYRAKMFANFMSTEEFISNARLPDHPESLYEGLAGTVCYLADILVPEKAEFPFQDIFSVVTLKT